MSVTISMAMREETSSPQCGSLIAHCTLEFDEEPFLPQDIEAFQHNIYSAIAACCRAVHEELRRERQMDHAAPCSRRRSNGDFRPGANGTIQDR